MRHRAVEPVHYRRQRREWSLYPRFYPVLSGLGALLAVAVLSVLVSGFPAGSGLWLVLLGYGALCLFSSYAWLVLLPVILVGLDLTTSTGRPGLNELDMALLVTMATGWLRQAMATGRAAASIPVARKGLLSVWLLYLVLLLLYALVRGGINLGPLTGAVYYAPDAAFLQTRGAVYGALLFTLWLPLYRQDPEGTWRCLVRGACLAGLLLALLLTWERGGLSDLFSNGPYYQRLRSLLDFSTPYRVTGLFSEMHAGGETIDGMLMLLLPLALVGAVLLAGWQRWIAVLAFVGLSYGVFSTFTRTTYAAYAISLGVFVLWCLYRQRDSLTRLSAKQMAVLAASGLGLLLLAPIYRFSGYMGLLAAGLILAAGLWGAAVIRGRWLLQVPLYGALIGLGLYGQLTSRWVDPGPAEVVLQAGMLCYLSLCSGFFAHHFRLRLSPLLPMGTVALALVVLSSAILSGYRMDARLETVTQDWQTRTAHWQDVMESMAPGLGAAILGTGRGQFSGAYALTHPGKVANAGGLRVANDGDSYLLLGRGGDLSLAQRLTLKPQATYRISFQVRAPEGGALSIGFCERNILYASDFSVPCQDKWVGIESSPDWKSRTLEIQAAGMGGRPLWKRWPTVFYLKNAGSHPLALDDLQVLASESRFNSLDNGGFERGLDYWYTYNDFKHLPWHIKNLWLALWFEGGLLGLLLFGWVCSAALASVWRQGGTGGSAPIGAGLSIFAVLLIGFFGNPLDSVRVSLLFHLLLMVLVFSPTTVSVSDKRATVQPAPGRGIADRSDRSAPGPAPLDSPA